MSHDCLIAWYNHSRFGFSSFRSHSHTSKTRQPAAIRWSLFRASRITLPRNFSAQNSTLVAGIVAYRQPSWRCQKQPCTKMHALYLASTISGCPTNALTWSRNLKPWACSNFRIFSSGLVFFLPIRDIMRERISLLTVSIFIFSRLIGAKLRVRAS